MFGGNKFLAHKEGDYINEKGTDVHYSIGDMHALVQYKVRKNNVLVDRISYKRRRAYIYTPFPYKYFIEYYRANKNSDLWNKRKYRDLKDFIEKKCYDDGYGKFTVISKNGMYCLCSEKKINYFRFHRKPNAKSINYKFQHLLNSSVKVQSMMDKFIKDNRPTWDKIKDFFSSHPTLVYITVRVGAAVLLAGVTELLFNALDASGVDPSQWFIPDGSDTGDAPLLSEGNYNGYDVSDGYSDTGGYSGDVSDGGIINDPTHINGLSFEGKQKLPITGGGLQTITVDDIAIPPNHSRPHVLYNGKWFKIVNGKVSINGHIWEVPNV